MDFLNFSLSNFIVSGVIAVWDIYSLQASSIHLVSGSSSFTSINQYQIIFSSPRSTPPLKLQLEWYNRKSTWELLGSCINLSHSIGCTYCFIIGSIWYKRNNYSDLVSGLSTLFWSERYFLYIISAIIFGLISCNIFISIISITFSFTRSLYSSRVGGLMVYVGGRG